MITSLMASDESFLSAVTQTLVSYAEVWIPSAGEALPQRAAACLTCPSGDRATESSLVDSGPFTEGLVSQVERQRIPIILSDAQCEPLLKISETCNCRILALVAIPVLCGQELRGIVVLGLGAGHGGAEVWTRNDRDELAVSSSFYSGLPSFEFVTQHSRFPKGAGAPGRIWKSGSPWIGYDPPNNPSFSRSFGNDPAQISGAIGLPIGMSHGFPAAVLLLLSDTETPFARCCELWQCEELPLPTTVAEDDPPDLKLLSIERIATHAHGRENYSTDVAETTLSAASGQQELLNQVALSRGPILLNADEFFSSGNFDLVVVVPLFDHKSIGAVLCLMY